MERRAAGQGDPPTQADQEGHHRGGYRQHARADHPAEDRR